MMEKPKVLSLDELIGLADMAFEGHILRDTLPFLLELKAARKRWELRCFHPDCNDEMTGATCSPVMLTHCLEHRAAAERINSNEAERQGREERK